MRIINQLLRKRIDKRNRKRLKNKDFSLLSSNCNGALILHDLGIRFNSPTVNLWIKPKDFIKFLKDIPHYISCPMTFTTEEGVSYPIGVLDDIRIYFQHYATPEEAEESWVKRSQRIDLQNLFILFTDRDGCTYQDLCDFEALPYKNKIVFTHLPYPELTSAFYMKGWETEESVGKCYRFVHKFSGKKYYDAFDYVSWFNGQATDT
ncbi:MAG: DUF1919 domain-containing protein [Clostridia bacterium]|nr:DUF1919 domain-containing protein [Clostridia bacterium]